MTWTKLGDEFADECWELPDDAFRLHVEGLIWSNSKHTDGRLLKAEMRRWAKHPEAASHLVNVGWWTDHGDHFQIIHHQGVQRTAAAWRAQSEVNAANGKKGGRPRRPKPETASVSTEVSTPSKTESLSEPLTEIETERDRTGQDSFLGDEGSRKAQALRVVPLPEDGCRVCGEPADSRWWPGVCEAHEADARAGDAAAGLGW